MDIGVVVVEERREFIFKILADVLLHSLEMSKGRRNEISRNMSFLQNIVCIPNSVQC